MRRHLLAAGRLLDVGRVAVTRGRDVHGCALDVAPGAPQLRVSGLAESLARELGRDLYADARVWIELGAESPAVADATSPLALLRALLAESYHRAQTQALAREATSFLDAVEETIRACPECRAPDGAAHGAGCGRA